MMDTSICVMVPLDEEVCSTFYIGVDKWSAGEVKLVFEKDTKEQLIDACKSSFSGGQIGVHLLNGDYSSDNLLAMSLVVDMVNLYAGKKPSVLLEYLPYSRQERITDDSPYVGLNIIKKLFNGCRILTTDAHNLDGAEDVLDDVLDYTYVAIHSNTSALLERLDGVPPLVFIAPDIGAVMRAARYAREFYSLHERGAIYTTITKKRVDGKVVSVLPEESIKTIERAIAIHHDAHFVVVDDIIDGGRTFINAGNLILDVIGTENKDRLHLLASHGIFSSSSTETALRELYANVIVYHDVKCQKRHD